MNGVIFQTYHWYTDGGGTFWNALAGRARSLAKAGFTAAWLPPAYKGAGGGEDVGYGVYDRYDLGEFDQKGSVATKYGSRRAFEGAVRTLQRAGLQVYADIVMNHMMGGDALESVNATPYGRTDRREPKGSTQPIRTYTHFQYPGRKGRYSTFEWRWPQFDATDTNADAPDDRDTIWLFEGKQFDQEVSDENGNDDYLMGCDLDFQEGTVREALLQWGRWFVETMSVDGLRLDALKHLPHSFIGEWLPAMRQAAGRELFAVGEYWSHRVESLTGYLESVQQEMSLFDVPLQGHFAEASRKGDAYDLRKIFDHTLVRQAPEKAVTFVSSHDAQPLQALESVVEPWFVPLAYALILLRQGGYPCVFVADYDGAGYEGRGRDGQTYAITLPSHRMLIDRFLQVRRRYLQGEQVDCFEAPNRIGWVSRGATGQSAGGFVVVLGNGPEGALRMQAGAADTVYRDVCKHVAEAVRTDAEGWADFPCPGRSLAVYVPG